MWGTKEGLLDIDYLHVTDNLGAARAEGDCRLRGHRRRSTRKQNSVGG